MTATDLEAPKADATTENQCERAPHPTTAVHHERRKPCSAESRKVCRMFQATAGAVPTYKESRPATFQSLLSLHSNFPQTPEATFRGSHFSFGVGMSINGSILVWMR